MKLELYYFKSCPFCQKVLIYLEGMNHDIIFYDTKIYYKYREKLIELNGKAQVPCLIVDDVPMLESDEIISFLEQNKSKWVKK